MYSSEREHWNHREWNDWTAIGSHLELPEESESNIPHRSTLGPQIVQNFQQAHKEIETRSLDDKSAVTRNSSRLEKLEQKIYVLEKKVITDVNKSAKTDTTSQSSLRRQLERKVTPSMIKLPRSLVNEILKYSKEHEGQTDKIGPENAEISAPDSQPLPDLKLFNYNPNQAAVVSYKVTSVHQLAAKGSKNKAVKPQQTRLVRKDRLEVEDPFHLSAHSKTKNGNSKDTGHSATRSFLGNVRKFDQPQAWDRERSSNPSAPGTSSKQLSRNPSQTMTVGKIY